ncbi:MAG: hypothetical protein E7135_08375 [Rikenellaceae bacterium]|nr:hypothetical protein [Rikenellaceae bacterium]
MKLSLNILSRLVLLLFTVGAAEVYAQEPKLSGRFSRDSIEVGDQVDYTLDIEVDRATFIGVPQFGESLTEAQKQDLQKRKAEISTFTDYQEGDFELIREYDLDTLKVEDRTLHLRKRYRLAAMETGDLVFRPEIIYLPKNSNEVDTLYADNLVTLHVKPYEELDTLNFLKSNVFTAPGMMPSQGPTVDTTLVNNHLSTSGLVVQRDMPFIRDEVNVNERVVDSKEILLVLIVFGVFIVVMGAILFYIYRKNRRSKFEEILLPPHVEANKALEQLHHRKLWQNDKHNLYYTLLTDILRRYISRRWEIRAMEFTTNETMEALRAFDIPNDSRLALHTILRTADMAKFAKAKPDDELNEECYTMAYYFVENTKVVDTEGVEGKEDITIDTKIGD